MVRTILLITGSRSEYGVLKPLMLKLTKSSKIKMKLFVTSMHLLKEYGYTIKEIKRDGFKIDSIIHVNSKYKKYQSTSIALGECIIGFTKRMLNIKIDLMVVIGDRFEMLAAACAASYLNIPIAHIHGGDTSGNIDDSVRDAISKLSHVHFPATKRSEKKLICIGENKKRIFRVGALAIDSIINETKMPKNEVKKIFNIDLSQPTIVVIQHPVNNQLREVRMQIKETLKAIKNLRFNTILIYPNSDQGNEIIIDEIEKMGKYRYIKIIKNLNHELFVNLIRYADVLIGNSSSAFIEAPSFDLPAVDIGIRQRGREHANNIIHVGHKNEDIKNAILRAIKIRKSNKKMSKPFGDGKTADRIVKILKGLMLNSSLLIKG